MKQININLEEEHKIPENSKILKQISQLKYRIKQTTYPTLDTMKDLEFFLKTFEKSPLKIKNHEMDIDDVWVFYKNLDYDDMGICFSTPKLLRNTLLQYEKDFPFFCIDGTYKLLKIGYPLLVIMTVDRYFQGHPVAFALVRCENEESYTRFLQELKKCLNLAFGFDYIPKYVMSDGSIPIRNTCKTVFPQITVLLCRFHMQKALNNKFSSSAYFSQEKVDLSEDFPI